MVQGSWTVSTPNNLPGSLHVIFSGPNGISSVLHTDIEGTTNPYIGSFLPGTARQVFVPGYNDSPVKRAQNYLVSVDVASGKLTKTMVGSRKGNCWDTPPAKVFQQSKERACAWFTLRDSRCGASGSV